jgi:4-carboxymuconolactone decarboxylase
MKSDGKAFLDDLARRHIHVYDFHRVLAEHDLDFLQAYEALMEAAYREPRRLPRLTKELVLVAVLAALGAPSDQLRGHMMGAAAEGATSADVLELLELVLPAAGTARFMESVEVWRDVFDF